MKKTLKNALLLASGALVASCTVKNSVAETPLTQSGLNPADFDTTYVDAIRGEKAVALYTLTNKNGMEVCVTNFGGRIVSIVVPDKDGNPTDVVLGYPTAQDYFPENNKSDFGSSVTASYSWKPTTTDTCSMVIRGSGCTSPTMPSSPTAMSWC